MMGGIDKRLYALPEDKKRKIALQEA